jgi:mannose-6-phosphate isomerase-like protein (cupin superfamily)
MSTDHSPIDISTAEHYVWGEVCDGWHLLKDPGLSVIQERVPPGTGEVMHFHTRARQFFHVLSGTATLEFKDRNVSFGAGQGVHVPPQIEHRFANHSDEEVVFLVISSPSTAGDRTNIGAL